MSSTSPATIDLLTLIADVQQAIAEGKPASGYDTVVIVEGETVAQAVKKAFNRDAANAAMPALVDATLGDSATASDEGALCATWERAVQGTLKSRIRNMSHTAGRARGQGHAQGILRYGVQELLVRPE